jgi:hypothetical protein
MLGPLVAFLLFLLSVLVPLLADRFMTSAPEWLWRVSVPITAVISLVILWVTEPVRLYLQNFREHVIVSTIIVVGSFGLIVATVWVFLIIGFPSSLPYTNFRIKQWLKSLEAPWSVKDAPSDSQVYFGFFVDRDEFGVGVSRPRDSKDDDHLNLDWALGLPPDELELFSRLSEKQKDEFIWYLKIEVLKVNSACGVSRNPNQIVYVRKMVPINGAINARTIYNAIHDCFSEFSLITLTLDKLLLDVSHKPTSSSPAQAPIQLLSPRFTEKFDSFIVSVGGLKTRISGRNGTRVRVYTFTPDGHAIGGPADGDVNGVVISVSDGQLLVDADIFTRAGEAPMRIRGNQIQDRPMDWMQPGWDRNSSPNALEIVNEERLPVFQIIYKDQAQAVINGVFVHGEKVTVLDNEQTRFGLKGGIASQPIRRIFKYPAWKHPGEFEDESLTQPLPTPNTGASPR